MQNLRTLAEWGMSIGPTAERPLWRIAPSSAQHRVPQQFAYGPLEHAPALTTSSAMPANTPGCALVMLVRTVRARRSTHSRKDFPR